MGKKSIIIYSFVWQGYVSMNDHCRKERPMRSHVETGSLVEQHGLGGFCCLSRFFFWGESLESRWNSIWNIYIETRMQLQFLLSDFKLQSKRLCFWNVLLMTCWVKGAYSDVRWSHTVRSDHKVVRLDSLGLEVGERMGQKILYCLHVQITKFWK